MLDLIRLAPATPTDQDRQTVLDSMRLPLSLRDFIDSLANVYAGGREEAERKAAKPPTTGDRVALLADCHRLEEEKVRLQAEVERQKVRVVEGNAELARSQHNVVTYSQKIHDLTDENMRLQLECEQLKTYVPYRKALQEIDRLKSLIAGDTSEIVKYRTDELERLEAKLNELRCKNAQRNFEILRLQAENGRLQLECERLQAFPAASRYHRLEAVNERLQEAVDRLSLYNEKLVAKSKLVPPCGSIVFTPTGEVRRAGNDEWVSNGLMFDQYCGRESFTDQHIYTRHEIPAEPTELPRGKPLPMEASDA